MPGIEPGYLVTEYVAITSHGQSSLVRIEPTTFPRTPVLGDALPPELQRIS